MSRPITEHRVAKGAPEVGEAVQETLLQVLYAACDAAYKARQQLIGEAVLKWGLRDPRVAAIAEAGQVMHQAVADAGNVKTDEHQQRLNRHEPWVAGCLGKATI